MIAESTLTWESWFGPDGKYVWVNPAVERFTGYSPDEILALPDFIATLIAADDRELVRSTLQSALQGSRGENLEIRCLHRDGRVFWLSVSWQPISDQAGSPLGVRCSGVDITERKLAKAALRASEARFRSFFDLPLHGRCITSPEKGWIAVNDKLCDMLGYSREEILTKTWSEMTHPDDLAADNAQFERLLAGEISQYRLEKRFVRKDGREIWTELSVGCVRKSDGTVDDVVAVLDDITERKRAEEELQNLRTAVEQTENTIVITDAEGRIEYVNPAFEISTGYSREEAMHQNPRILSSGEQGAAFYRALWGTITAGQTWRGEFHNRRKDGALYWESATISPVQRHDGKILHFIAIKENITARKALESNLRDALDRAESANRAKSEFLAVMSHELRTPLNGILGFAELLSESRLDSEQKEFSQVIVSCGNHLLGIVNDILDFSSIEKGSMRIEAAPVRVAEVVEDSLRACEKSAADKGLDLRCEMAPNAAKMVQGDARRIRQILINLLGNAVKFTSQGKVILRTEPACQEGDRFLNFTIEDTGPGIPREAIALLFQPFSQADSTLNRPFEGTGLGLAISKRLAEAMGGEIRLVSTPGVGSRFTLRLPVAADEAPSRSSSQAPAVPASKKPAAGLVLVVEDEPTNSALAGKMLEVIGYRAAFASDGQAAVEMFAPGKYHAILMDMQMPVVDGLEATKKIREIERLAGGHVRIIALTANVLPGDRERCLAGGMDDFLTKPFTKRDLEAKLAGF